MKINKRKSGKSKSQDNFKHWKTLEVDLTKESNYLPANLFLKKQRLPLWITVTGNGKMSGNTGWTGCSTDLLWEQKSILEPILFLLCIQMLTNQRVRSLRLFMDTHFDFPMWIISFFLLFLDKINMAGSNCPVISCISSKKYKLLLYQTCLVHLLYVALWIGA